MTAPDRLIVYHLESGLKAVIDLQDPGHRLTYWRRWDNTTGTYVDVNSPLLKVARGAVHPTKSESIPPPRLAGSHPAIAP